MRTDIKAKWLKALTSGEYQQTTGKLGRVHEDGSVGYCCLGVLCDLVKDDLDIDVIRAGGVVIFGGEETLPSRSVATAVGLADSSPSYEFEAVPDAETWDYQTHRPLAPFDDRGNWVELHLPGLNDEGFTFDQIADIIRWAEPEVDSVETV